MIMKMPTCALIVWLIGSGCSGKSDGSTPTGAAPSGAKKPSAFPVEVAPVETRKVQYTLTAVGSVEAFETVQITARVAGVVDVVRFVEGQSVRVGDVLVEIDARRFGLAVRAAQATVDRSVVAQADAAAALQRRELAAKSSPGLITDDELATFRSRAAAAEADLSAARVALERSQIDFQDARVRAPAPGVLQTRSVQTGQYVQPGTVLATLMRRDPLLLRFKVPEQEAGRIEVGSTVTFSMGGSQKSLSARITAVTEAADSATRMSAVTAEVSPGDRSISRPGSFAEVIVPIQSKHEATVIAQTAVRPSERGFLAFVVDGDVARERIVSLGLRTPDGLIEVREGLKAGETLVIRGGEALRDGAAVRIVSAPTGGREPGVMDAAKSGAGGTP